MNTKLKWIATATTIAGALATSFRIDPLNIYLLNLGSIFWLWWSIRIKEHSIIVVNTALLIIYIFGLFVK